MNKTLKSLILPNHPVKCPIIFGPLRGAKPLMNPRESLRYMLGLYEHELNPWLTKTISTVNTLFDVGANHGYFGLGIMSAGVRAGLEGDVWAFEPQSAEVKRIQTALGWHEGDRIRMRIKQCFVSDTKGHGAVTLDQYVSDEKIPLESKRSLIKIDVEGAELEVLHGGTSLVLPQNRFLVEAHSSELLDAVLEFFREHRHPVEVIYQKPLPLLGREHRDLENFWGVSAGSDSQA